jgi:hypothetical protein
MLNKMPRWTAAALLVLSIGTTAIAQTSNTIEVHGFGGWAYGKTDGLAMSIGTKEGAYDNAQFALNVSAKPYDKLSLVAQTRLTSAGGADLDYAFAEWSFSDAVKFRAGRVKHPFGIYGEVFDLGTVRPFDLLPQSLYGPNGFTARAYNGAGITGNVRLPHHFAVQYDVYGGQIQGDFETPGLLAGVPELFTQPNIKFDFHVDNTVGGRFSVATPIDGLSIGASGYRGKAYTGLSNISTATREVTAEHIDYSGSRLTVRAENGRLVNGTDFSVNSRYAEVAYKLTSHWQIAGRTEKLNVDPNINLSELPSIYGQLLRNSENALGISYWFRPDFVIRASYHAVEGNRFAFPETSADVVTALTTDHLAKKTNMIVFGAQFSF